VTVDFHRYTVTIEFEDRLAGGIPMIPPGTDRADAYERWAKGQGVEPEEAREGLAEALAAEGDMPVGADDVEGLQTGFRRDDTGIYIEARQVKAMLRESAQRLGIIVQKRGTRQVIQHDLHVRALDGGQKLRLLMTADGKDVPLEAADGTDQRPISVVTRQGPRTALKRFEYVEEARLSFQVMILAGGVGDNLIGPDELQRMLEFGGMLGLGADRSQGMGTFTVVSLEPVEA
jgi:hypothetical protein